RARAHGGDGRRAPDLLSGMSRLLPAKGAQTRRCLLRAHRALPHKIRLGVEQARASDAHAGNAQRTQAPISAEDGDRGLYGSQERQMSEPRARKRDRIVAGHFTTIPASLFSSPAWEALSPTA